MGIHVIPRNIPGRLHFLYLCLCVWCISERGVPVAGICQLSDTFTKFYTTVSYYYSSRSLLTTRSITAAATIHN